MNSTSCAAGILRAAGEYLPGLPSRTTWHRVLVLLFMGRLVSMPSASASATVADIADSSSFSLALGTSADAARNRC